MIEIISSSRQVKSSPSFDVDVYHITNPNPSSWEPLAQVLSQACAAKLIPLHEWVQSLEIRLSTAKTDQDLLRRLPAAQLLDFFQGLVDQVDWTRPPAETSNSQKYSAAMRDLGPVDTPLVKVWLQQWKDSISGLSI